MRSCLSRTLSLSSEAQRRAGRTPSSQPAHRRRLPPPGGTLPGRGAGPACLRVPQAAPGLHVPRCPRTQRRPTPRSRGASHVGAAGGVGLPGTPASPFGELGCSRADEDAALEGPLRGWDGGDKVSLVHEQRGATLSPLGAGPLAGPQPLVLGQTLARCHWETRHIGGRLCQRAVSQTGPSTTWVGLARPGEGRDGEAEKETHLRAPPGPSTASGACACPAGWGLPAQDL